MYLCMLTCASDNAVSYSAPSSSILHNIKLVVPFIIPLICMYLDVTYYLYKYVYYMVSRLYI